MLYLDNAATTQIDPRVLETMLPYLGDKYGNPSSIHHFGQQAHLGINVAREIISLELGVGLEDVFFTSGATESNNTILRGLAHSNRTKGGHIITSAIEHPCVLESCKLLEKEGFEITYLGVDSEGIISLEDLRNAIKETTILISIMAANNETGSIQPVAEIGQIAKEKNILFHTDAVQYFPYFSCNLRELNIDAITLSAHKMHGPKGVGVVAVKKRARPNLPQTTDYRLPTTDLLPLIGGGGQEFGLRSGTQNVPGIAGFGKAVKIVTEEREKNREYISELKINLWESLQKAIPGIQLNGPIPTTCNLLPVTSSPHILNVSIPGIIADDLVVKLDLKGIAVSTGSACSNIDSDISHVLLAIGKTPEQAKSSIRISLSKYTTQEELDQFVEILKTAL